MTDTQWLLDLVEETTRSAQVLNADGSVTYAPWIDMRDFDVRFIALAPDLARLVVEQHEALERLRTNAGHIFDKQPVRDWGETLAEADAALARFAELKP